MMLRLLLVFPLASNPLPNDPPIANEDALTIAPNRSVDIPVLANDTDSEMDLLSIVAVGAAQHGTVELLPGPHQLVRYTPAANSTEFDEFTYLITDSARDRQPVLGFVSINVLPFSVPTIPAFPGAEGPGAVTRHGRGGRIVYVENLSDSGPGSLRAALAPGLDPFEPRIVLFRVAGTIHLRRPIDIDKPFLYIAGQSAPGDGITLAGSPATAGQPANAELLNIRTHDVCIRYLRLRCGRQGVGTPVGNQGQHAIQARGQNLIFDHLSVSWNLDDNGPWIFAHELGEFRGFPIYNQTWQRCLFGEALAAQSTSFLMGGSRDFFGAHTGTPFQLGQHLTDILVHRSLFAHNGRRCPQGQSRRTRIINNVIYNWSTSAGATIADAEWDYRNNYYRPGPMTGSVYLLHEGNDPEDSQTRIYHVDSAVGGPPSIFVAGNVFAPDRFSLPNVPTPNQWKHLAHAHESRLWRRLDPLPLEWQRAQALPQGSFPVTIQSAIVAYRDVLADVGANRRLEGDGRFVFRLDSVDARLIQDVRMGTGPSQPITGEDAVGGYPTLLPGSPYADLDADGMGDAWEEASSLDPRDPTDGSDDLDGDGYTNVEEFLNGSVP
jgi:hypothetical protein